MKKWIATYTDDCGQTTKTMPVQATTYTQAYLTVYRKITGIITELNEVKYRARRFTLQKGYINARNL